ncbi:unnamed protein product [Sympodiomycopsis kandeliae]
MEEEQLVQAVAIASNPTAVQDPSLPQQALAFLEHLKTITHQSWTYGWAVFAARNDAGDAPKYPEQARLFGLNLVADFLEDNVSQSSDPAGSVTYLQDSALSYIHAEFVAGSGERGASYLKNKLAQVLTMLVMQSYSLPQQSTLLPTLISLIRTPHASSSGPSSSSASSSSLNPITTDLVLRVLHDLSITLGSDVTLRSVRSKDRLQRDSVIRDEIRANHAVAVAENLWGIIEEGMSRLNNNANSSNDNPHWSLAKAAEITEMATSVVGDYVSWIDISLVVTPHTVSLFYALLQHSSLGLRKAAADALLEVISKGMKSAGKLELLSVLDLTNVVGALEAETRTNGSQGQDHIVELREKLARLANGVTLELVKILEDNANTDESTRSAADDALLRHLSLILAFLADEYDEPTECILSGVNSTLSYYKKLKKRLAAGQSLPAGQLDALSRLVDVALGKMKYDDEAEWTGAGTRVETGDDAGGYSDEEEAHFVELRKQLQQILASVASIEESIFASRIQSLIIETLLAVEAGINGSGQQVTWQQAEVAVFAAYFYVEVLINAQGQPKSGVNVNAFVQMPPGTEASRAKQRLQLNVYPTLPLNQLGETVQSIVQSSVASFPHPAVQLQFFECLNRYAPFFLARPDNLPSALFAWLDSRGLYNGHTGVRHRIWYLFSRFIRETSPVIPADYTQRVIDGMRDVLVVQAELPAASNGDEDPLVKATEAAGPFDSQLYLFESSGLLLSNLRNESDRLVSLLNTVCDPLVNQLQQAVQSFNANQSNLREVLQVHHLMLAMSNLAKGFPDVSAPSGSATNANSGNGAARPDDAWVQVFKSVTEQILIALGQLNQFAIVREAARGAFSRIVATTGEAVLPFIPNLIQALLSQVTTVELVDFLSFLGLVVAKYKHKVQPMLDELLLVLIERVFHFLNMPVSGTDDAVQRSELQRSYINFLSQAVTSGIDGILTSDRNLGQLQTILQSIVYYANEGDQACQRSSFGILSKLVVAWAGSGTLTSENNGVAVKQSSSSTPSTNGKPASTPPNVTVPGFETFIYDTLVPLTFEVPAKQSFDFTDAQSQLVLTEICVVLKTILNSRGSMEVSSFLLDVYFPKIGCPNHIGVEFIENLNASDARKFKVYFQGFISQSRG